MTDPKLRAAIHYLCERNGAVLGALDRAGLNKVLWHADTLTYMARGRSITGAKYLRRQNGPVAQGHEGVIKELIREERIRRVPARGGRRGLYANGAADKSHFSLADLAMLDRVYNYIASTAPPAVAGDSGWKSSRDYVLYFTS